mmetsp:Transcript_31139/g.81621  ORF Transcript_31139/g.81621 Transcript_31139/m.81621 type:complete len:351 (+) Transcript_31139:319-1371(+)
MESEDRARGFRADRTTTLTLIVDALEQVWAESGARPFIVLNVLSALWAWVVFAVAHRTNSLALTAFGFWCIRDVLAVTRRVVRFWVVRTARLKKSQYYTFGFGRLEVLVSFTSSVVTLLAAVYTLAESLERISPHPKVHAYHLAGWSIGAAVAHVLVLMSLDVPILPRPRSRPIGTSAHGVSLELGWLSVASVVMLLVSSIALVITPVATIVDTFSAISIAMLLGIAAIPGVESAALILMQSAPNETVQRIQKCLREMATFEGVLEFQQQHFWLVHEGELAGSVHVRVRRDADSQAVLAQVHNKMAHLVAPRNLTVQVVKDDWMQAAIPVTPRPSQLDSDPFGTPSDAGV